MSSRNVAAMMIPSPHCLNENILLVLNQSTKCGHFNKIQGWKVFFV